jgi:pimeloyl-ACP methyl ester carboxylesterase
MFLLTRAVALTAAIAFFSQSLLRAQSVRRIDLDTADFFSGHYLSVEPKDSIRGVLVLLAGFGQRAEDVFPETRLQTVAHSNSILTVAFAAGPKLYADSVTEARLSVVLKDVMTRYKIRPDAFVLGGFSAGGIIALRYVERCLERPGNFPIRPRGIFLVDSPIDLFVIWETMEANARTRYSEPAVMEAEHALAVISADLGTPSKNTAAFARVNPFNMNRAFGEPEKVLKDFPVRAYHDVDVAWRLVNRNQTVHNSNYEVTSELINRLLLLGNKQAEFMQTFKTGYRANGQRHPHSWSIVDAEECIEWVKRLLQ